MNIGKKYPAKFSFRAPIGLPIGLYVHLIYIDAIPQTDNTRVAVASVFSVIRNCSVPYGISTEGFPNLSTTRWRIVADQKNMVYYFEDALSPNAVWVDFKNLDFSQSTGKVKKLSLDKQQVYAGETSDKFVVTKP